MRLITRAELARHLGVNPVAVTQACRERIKDACVGQRVDLDHDLVREWIKKRRGEQTQPAETQAQPTQIVAGDSPRADQNGPLRAPTGIEDVEGFEDLTIREVIARWGGMSMHADWLAMRRTQTMIREREIKNAVLEGKLISRDAVRTHVFGAIDNAFRRLLQDSPKTIARRVYAMARSNEPVDKAEDLVRDSISSVLKPVKETAARALRAPSKSVDDTETDDDDE